jgi:uncharacterized protein YkwD
MSRAGVSRRHFLGQAILCAGGSGCAAIPAWPRQTSPQPSHGDEPAPEGDPAKFTEDLVSHHNRIRRELKLSTLSPSKKLEQAAEDHVLDMAQRRKMTHKGSDGSTPSSRVLATGYRLRRCGENIAFGQRTVEAVMKVWMNSPPHKANILGNFSQIGAAYATARDGTAFWCVTFGFPARAR